MSELRRSRAGRVPTVARHGRLARSSVARSVVGLVGSALAVVLVAALSVVGIAGYQLASSVESGVHLRHVNGATAPPGIDAIRGGVNLLLVGTDTRTGQQGALGRQTADSSGVGNNDVTILLHVSQDHRSVTIVSFPRDLLLTIPACPNPKNGGTYGATSGAMLNTALSRGGLACPVLTIEKLTGITIPYAAEISFDGVAAMSNVVGGVTVCVSSPINDPASGLQLTAGEHTIQGYQALAFVRVRHGIADGSDLSRISNQQVFLSALARKITSDGVLKNPIKLYEIARAAASNMTLSDELGHPDTMVAIALALKSVPLQDMVMVQFPVVSAPGDANRVVPAIPASTMLTQALVKDQPIVLSGTTGSGAQLDPNASAPAPAATPGPSAPATGTAPATPAPTSTAPTAVTLPSTVTGQTAAQQTCSKGNGR